MGKFGNEVVREALGRKDVTGAFRRAFERRSVREVNIPELLITNEEPDSRIPPGIGHKGTWSHLGRRFIPLRQAIGELLAHLPSPHPVLADEVIEAARVTLFGASERFEDAYRLFQAELESTMVFGGQESVVSIPVWRGVQPVPEALAIGLPCSIFQNDAGFGMAAHIVNMHSSIREYPEWCAVNVNIECDSWSKAAFDRAVAQANRVVASAFRSLDESRHFDEEFVPDDDFRAWSSGHFAQPEPDQNGLRMLGWMAAAYWLEPRGVDRLTQRIHNAMHLLVESDHVAHSTTQLVLATSAIEAMLGDGEDGLSESLARKAAALLQPVPQERPHARKRIKALYGDRSRFVHGANVRERAKEYAAMRKLAAGVLKGTLEWVAFAARADITGDEFLRQLDDADKSDKRMVGVPDRLSACLPK